MIDCHCHTQISPDADKNVTVEDYCNRAKEIGLEYLAVTEHVDLHVNYDPKTDYTTLIAEKERFEKSMKANTEMKARYPFLINGVELGQATQDVEFAEQVAADPRLDFIIASMHQLPNEKDFAFINYKQADTKKLLRENFLEIRKLCEWGKFDVLGHLTYVLRYMAKMGVQANLSPYRDIIADSFKLIIGKGKGIEINTSGLRQAFGKTFPSLKYVKLFKDLGGEYVTVGSDAHYLKDIGAGVKDGADIANAAGFRYITVFKNHNPILIDNY